MTRNMALISLIITASLAALPVYADDGPVILGRAEHPPILTLDRFTGSLNLLSMFEYDNSKSSGSNTSSTSTLLQEGLTLGTGGGVISRSFFDWHGSVTIGLNENWSNSPTESNNGYAFAPAYDFNGTLLGSTILPSNFYARRTESYVAQTFQPFVKNTYSEYGANINYQSPSIPTSLGVSHNDTTQTSGSGASQFALSENNINFQTAFDPLVNNHLALNYQYSDVEQNNPQAASAATGDSSSASSQSQSISLSHFWQIDNDGRYTLSQNFGYSTQGGTFPFESLRLSENLRLRHTDYFETNLQYNYDQQQYISSFTRTQQIIGGFTHRLYESLTTNGQVGTTISSNSFASNGTTSSSDSSTNSYYADLNFNYTKKVPFGVLGANLSLGYNQTDNGAIGSLQPVLNDTETFTDPQPIIITRANVDPNTIAVFNAAGTRQYINGTDFIVTRVGNTLQINRLFTGNINPGDTVRLDYDIDPLPGYSSSTTNIAMGLNYAFTKGPFSGLSVFGQYADQNQSTSSSAIRADQIMDTRFGADYRFWKFTLHADRENRQSTLAAYDSTSFSLHYADRLSQRSSFSLGASQAFIDYPSTGAKTSLTSVDGHLDYQISRELKATATGLWRNDQDSIYGNNMGFELQGDLRWTIRQMQIFLLLRYTDLEATSNSADSLSVQLGLSRSF